ncbi:MAG: PorT family protein [Bacteroidetes bacterium]|jgi:hypothetical protein|nr:PorT family protein [Bacteroidota bacterium]
MQRYILMLSFFISSFSYGQATIEAEHENFFRFGAKAGVNVNKFQGQSYKKGFSYNFQAGAFLQFNLNKRFGVQPEVNFVQASSELTKDASDISDDLFGGGDQHKAKLNYLEIPVLLNVNVGESRRVKLQAGPAYGFLLKQKVDSLAANKEIYKKSEWSIMGGLWIQLPVIHLGARYKYGLTDINNKAVTGSKESWKNQSIQIFLGVTI